MTILNDIMVTKDNIHCKLFETFVFQKQSKLTGLEHNITKLYFLVFSLLYYGNAFPNPVSFDCFWNR